MLFSNCARTLSVQEQMRAGKITSGPELKGFLEDSSVFNPNYQLLVFQVIKGGDGKLESTSSKVETVYADG